MSKRQAIIDCIDGSYRYVQLGETNPTCVDGRSVQEYVMEDGDRLTIGPAGGPQVSLLFVNPTRPQDLVPAEGVAGKTPATVSSVMVKASLEGKEAASLGRGSSNDLVLPSMHVSRRHALIAKRDGGHVLKDLGSTNGTFLNGSLLDGEELLRDGDSIRIGPFRLTYSEGALRGYNEERAVRLDALGVGKRIGSTQILKDVSFTAFPGELIAIIGASGSGKTTLMDALNGIRRASEGVVRVNGIDLYDRFDSVRPLLGYVPQFSILHDSLPLERALFYTGRLRFADDVEDIEVRRKVKEVMRSLDLHQRAKVPVGRLSGGQQRRASLAAELLTEPGLLFLDEPTTGLDAGLTRRLMQSFRALADEGRTVILVTHDTESLELCDLIVFLTAGKVVYLGQPAEAPAHFEVHDMGAVYGRLEDDEGVEEWHQKCLASNDYEKYVERRQAGLADQERPEEFGEVITPGSGNVGLSIWRQLAVLAKRYMELIFAIHERSRSCCSRRLSSRCSSI